MGYLNLKISFVCNPLFFVKASCCLKRFHLSQLRKSIEGGKLIVGLVRVALYFGMRKGLREIIWAGQVLIIFPEKLISVN